MKDECSASLGITGGALPELASAEALIRLSEQKIFTQKRQT